MVILPLSTGFIFPSDFKPEAEKAKKEFGSAVARALYSRYSLGGTYGWSFQDINWLQEVRDYGDGIQSERIYREWYTNGSAIGSSSGRNTSNQRSQTGNNNSRHANLMNTNMRVAMANISYKIYSPVPKFSNVIISMLSENDYRVDCTSVDQEALEAKAKAKLSALYRSTIINPLAEQLGLPPMELPTLNGRLVNIRNEKDLEMYERRGLFKTDIERTLEMLAETGFRLSDWKNRVRRKTNKDAIDFNFRCAKIYNDPETGAVKARYVDVTKLVMIWNDYDEEPCAIGDIRAVQIQSIYTKLVDAGYTENEIKGIAQFYQGQQQTGWRDNSSIFERKDPLTGQWTWMDFKVPVMELDYLSTDHKQFVKGRDKKGNKFYKKNDEPVPEKKKDKDREYDDFKCNYWYEGSYIVGTDKIFGWRKKPNQMHRSKLNPMSSYVFDKAVDNGQALTQRVTGLCDDLQMALLKKRAAVWAAAPKGYEIDLAEGANLKIGGQEFSVFDLIHMHRQNGIKIKASRYNATTGKTTQSPIKEQDNGLGPQGQEWLNEMAACVYEIANTMGITDAMAAQPDQSAEKAVGLMEGEIMASNHALYPLKESDIAFKLKVAQRLILQTRLDIEYDPRCRKFYEGQIGKHGIEVLDSIEGITLETLGITMKALPTKKQKDLILARAVEMSKIATRDGTTYLSPSDVEHVSELLENDDVEGARYFMEERERYNRAEAERISTQAVAQNAEEARNTAAFVEGEKQKTDGAKTQGELAKIAAQGEEDRKTLQTKVLLEGPQKINEIREKGAIDSQITTQKIAGDMITDANRNENENKAA